MNSLPSAPLYLSIESDVMAECTTTADCMVVEGRILDGLGVEDQEGVTIDFNHQDCTARVSGLRMEDRTRLMDAVRIDGGLGVGQVNVLPDPDAEDADKTGC